MSLALKQQYLCLALSFSIADSVLQGLKQKVFRRELVVCLPAQQMQQLLHLPWRHILRIEP